MTTLVTLCCDKGGCDEMVTLELRTLVFADTYVRDQAVWACGWYQDVPFGRVTYCPAHHPSPSQMDRHEWRRRTCSREPQLGWARAGGISDR